MHGVGNARDAAQHGGEKHSEVEVRVGERNAV